MVARAGSTSARVHGPNMHDLVAQAHCCSSSHVHGKARRAQVLIDTKYDMNRIILTQELSAQRPHERAVVPCFQFLLVQLHDYQYHSNHDVRISSLVQIWSMHTLQTN